jgi:hypothetical protein
MGVIDRFRQWLDSPAPEPRPDATVELAWLPLWQAHLVVPELWDAGIPVALVEDHTSHLRGVAREPMARLFVLAHRRELARAVMRDVTGHEPGTLRS